MKEKKQLYCCCSYYQLMIALMQALSQDQRIDLLLEEHGIETAPLLAERLKKGWSETVDRVFICPNDEKVDPYKQRSASFLPWQRRRIVNHMEQVFGEDGRRLKDDYERINVFWDLGYAGVYLNICGAHYRLYEDSLDSYKHIRQNRPHYAYIFDQKGLTFRAKKYFHTGVIPFGYSDCCDSVEVNDIEGIEIPTDKVQEVPRSEMEENLKPEHKKALFQLFTGDETGNSGLPEGSVLILTEPFSVTDRLPDERTQALLYRQIIKAYGSEGKTVIKPHPRDVVDYTGYFPDALVMDKDIPMEILNLDETFHVSRAVTVTSSVIKGIRFADERISLGPDYLKNFLADL